ncbi:MAG: redoxin domain-containing protein [Bacteroidia bacterium]|nr:redoxin domain-containing protein [Bacteroidia bacterium]
MQADLKIIKILFSLFGILLLQGTEARASQPVRIFGNILNDETREISLSFREHPLAEMETIKAKLDRQGNFQLKLNIEKARPCYLRYGREQSVVYLFPGDRIDLIADAESFDETLVFTGYGSGVNASQFLAAFFLKFEDKLFRREANNRIKEASPASYLEYLSRQKEYKLNFLDENKDLPEDFVDYMAKRIEYMWGRDLLEYPVKHAYLNELPYERVPVGTSYYGFLNELNIQDKEAWELREYQDFLDAFFAYEYSKVISKMSPSSRFAYLYDRAPDYLTGMPLSVFRARSLMHAIQYLNPGDVLPRYFQFVNSEEGLALKEYLEYAFKDILALAPGNPAPDFSLEDREGKMVSLSDYQGKTIYLHFWASWCDPCKNELSYINKLAFEFSDEDIVILNVSLDEFQKTWLQKVEETQLAGIHVWAKGLWSEVPMSYGIRTLPGYMIISKDGTIANASAFAPSNPEASAQILRNLR